MIHDLFHIGLHEQESEKEGELKCAGEENKQDWVRGLATTFCPTFNCQLSTPATSDPHLNLTRP